MMRFSLITAVVVAFFALASCSSTVLVSAETHDLFKFLNSFMCSTGSEHCIENVGSASASVDWPVLKEKMIRRTLEFAHEMVVPAGVKQLALRSMFPAEVRDMFATAASMREDVPAGTSILDQHRASAKAIKLAIQKIRGVGATKYPYFGWVPQEAGDALVDTDGISFATSCLGNVKVRATNNATSGSVNVKTEIEKSGFLCNDVLLMVAGGESFTLQVLDKEGDKSWSFPLAHYQAWNTWYLKRHGVRVLRFPKGLLETIGQVVETVTLLVGFAEMPLSDKTLDDNVAFLQDYVQFSPRMQGAGGKKIVRRTGGIKVGLAMEPHIQSGDAFIVLRPDGMDPMIAWGQGTISGHSTIALRNSSGHLHVCESTVKGAYYPTNGIQCHTYKEYLELCSRAQMSILLTPMSAAYRARFDSEKAWAFYRAHRGVNYCYKSFIFGWVDTANKNFPCLPPDFKTCLDPQAVEQLVLLVDRLQGMSLENIFRWAINARVNATYFPVPYGMPVIQTFYHTAMRNRSATLAGIYTMPELDSYKYNMTMNDGSYRMTDCSVCCVFVCKMWKAAGVFSAIDSDINCGEQALWDIFSTKLFDESTTGGNRPAICKEADPDTPLCQVSGEVLNFPKPDWKTRVPYKRMGEHCSSVGPGYVREPGC